MRLLVFAYGSNLDLPQMLSRCPSVRYEDRARLVGYRLAFAGHSVRWSGPVATVTRARDALVHGVVYSVTFADLVALDRAEGVPIVYRRRAITCELRSGAKARAYTYQLVRGAEKEGVPGVAYRDRIACAYHFWRLPSKALARAIVRARRALRPA